MAEKKEAGAELKKKLKKTATKSSAKTGTKKSVAKKTVTKSTAAKKTATKKSSAAAAKKSSPKTAVKKTATKSTTKSTKSSGKYPARSAPKITTNVPAGADLVIVESPAKAQTIQKFLGGTFVVVASFGHIADLVKKNMGIDTAKNFAPSYEIIEEKKPLVNQLKKFVKSSAKVWLATDEDREGEAIARHLQRALDLPKNTARIAFHEITKPALDAAVKNPRVVDESLVDAQQARRVLDRLVGFELSPLLWKKIARGLSAGRVQSVAVRLLVEKEREIQKFNSEPVWKTAGIFEKSGKKFVGKLDADFADEKSARKFLEVCQGAEFQVESVVAKKGKKNPGAPFTTSSLQQEASNRLGYGVAKTMRLAQRLYEAGFISYMRTDSIQISPTARKNAAAVIAKKFGKDAVETRVFSTKKKSAQEAHECIRPTDFAREGVGKTPEEKKLYTLIRQRAIASQMASALVEKTTAKIAVVEDGKKLAKELFVATGERILSAGFLKVYGARVDDDEKEDAQELPAMKDGEILKNLVVKSEEKYARHPARFTEARLVKKLEELGIGRPSTYAPTIQTIVARNYAEKSEIPGEKKNVKILTLEKTKIGEEEKEVSVGADRGKLVPTDIGFLVTDFLVAQFPEVMDYGFTATVEENFDEIARGERAWQEMIKKFYGPFHKNVEKSTEKSERQKVAKELGRDPRSGEPVFAKFGRYGPYLQIGEGTETEKPKFLPLRLGKPIENVSFEDVLPLLEFPKKIGEKNGAEIRAKIGRYGAYLERGTQRASVAMEDAGTLSVASAVKLIEEDAKSKSEGLKTREIAGKTVALKKGRYGQYLQCEGKNFSIPSKLKPRAKELTDTEIKEILAKKK